VAPTNVELVRSLFAAWQRGDFSSTEWADPEIEFVIADGPDPGTFTGLRGMADAFRVLVSADRFQIDSEEYRELDDERVLVHSRWSGRAKRGGLDMGQLRAKGAHLFHVRDGKVARLVFYFGRERALADLGLAPDAGSR
jgi:ketosteroid isomerase-like protein